MNLPMQVSRFRVIVKKLAEKCGINHLCYLPRTGNLARGKY
jgi:hypothetical protein